MSSLVFSSQFPDSIAHGTLFDAAFLQGYDDRPELYPRIARVYGPEQSPAKDRVRLTSIAGLGAPDAVDEGQEVPSDAPLQGWDKTLVFKKFGKAVDITDEALADDRLGALTEAVRRMGNGFRDWAEAKVAGVYNDAFAGAMYTGGDGKPLCAVDHPRLDGGPALSNRSTAALSAEALDDALTAVWGTLDNRGRMAALQPKMLLVPPKLWSTAVRLTGSPRLPGGAHNDVNPVYGLGLEVIVNPWLQAASGGSDTAWFLIDPVYLDVCYFQRTAVVSEAARETSKQVDRYQVTHRAAFGFNEWRGVYGSTGTATAPTPPAP